MALKVKSADKLQVRSGGPRRVHDSPLAAGHGRIEFAPTLEVWVGGGEYNVAYALVAARPAHRLGRRAQHVADGRDHRQPRPRRRHGHLATPSRASTTASARSTASASTSPRSATRSGPRVTLYDRGHTATAGMKPGDVNWKKLFGEARRPLAAHRRHLRRPLRRHAQGRRRSGEGRPRGRHDRQLRPQLPLQALVVARKRSRRPSRSCRTSTASSATRRTSRRCSATRSKASTSKRAQLDTSAFKAMVNRVVKDYPERQGRRHDAPRREDGPGQRLVGHHVARRQVLRRPVSIPNLEIEDRVGGGDGFASGFTYGFLTGQDAAGMRRTSASPTARC